MYKNITLSIGVLAMFSLLLLSASNAAAQTKQDVVIHQGEGLWILRQPWPESDAWCRNGGGNPAHKIYDVYTYYDAPHERRMERLGSSYDAFIRDKVIAGIRRLCGIDTAVTYLVVAMYKKRDETEPSGLIEDLSKSQTQPWDFISFTVDGRNVTPVKHEAKEAAYHLTPEELRTLDPRSAETVQQARVASQFSDYSLYEGDGFTVTSLFDRPGKAWCEHVYVPTVVTYNGSDDEFDLLFEHGYEAFLQAEIVPKIQGICPNFPNAAEYFKQTIRLEFKRMGESRVTSFMGFTVAQDGTVAWREGRQTKRQIAQIAAQREEEERQAAAQREKEARQASARKVAGDFIEVECSQTITGFMHTDTIVPYVKMISTLNEEESTKMADDMADCFGSLTTVLQLSNPYASSVKFDVFDNSGKSFVQNDVQLTPKSVMEPLHQPEKLQLFSGSWKTDWYEVEIDWDWTKSEFKGVVSKVSEKGATLGFEVSDEVLTARIFPMVRVTETDIAIPVTLRVWQIPEPTVSEGGVAIWFETRDYMMFSQGKGGDSIIMEFERVDSP